MQIASGSSSLGEPKAASSAPGLRPFVFALFFVFGGITSLNDVLIPKLKSLFSLNYAEAMLVQFAFFLAYFLVSAPAGALIQRIGYLRAAVLGLMTMTLGCLLFIPACAYGLYAAFLVALFVLASGITIVQVVVNPLICVLGAPETAHSRLNFAQAFNSLGTTLFPYLGALLILRPLADGAPAASAAEGAFNPAEAAMMSHTYLALALFLLLVAAVVWLQRNRLTENHESGSGLSGALTLLRRPRLALGALGIFVYVGAEVAIGSMLVSYLMQADTMALTAETAGKRVALYWGGALFGRFAGAELLRRFSPPQVLTVAALGAMGLLLLSGFGTGALSGAALISVGLFNSVMFPTIFSLASEGLGDRAPGGSGLICMAIVGGAIVPVIAGAVADVSTLRAALLVPFLCYGGIAAYGRFCNVRPVGAD
ncbi:sugar MFS transporter [Solimonas terrae]|uniref:Sugar MFS transporter n=1 Tax=Solimonas terrae TaxID=1396819 RepID=A0A6M2BTA4_9GAMM|nr:sugar MFS transporter [Solimonas terrae]NGY05594.1 sugar MFS transporter [Solimonas terrae]